MAELIAATVNTLEPEAEPGVDGVLVTSGMIPRMALLAEDLVEPLVEPVTLDEAKRQLRLEGVLDDEDALISSMITAAREMAEGKLNRTLVRRVREVAAPSWGPIALRKPPFVQLESVTYFDPDGQSFEVESSDLAVSSIRVPAQVSLRYGFQAPQLARQDEAIIVRYTAGYAPGEVPRMIVQWMLLVIGALYAHRESFVAGVTMTMIPEDFNKWLLQPHMVYE